jgi:RNA polymerase sigma-70 factor, ECF subfamily
MDERQAIAAAQQGNLAAFNRLVLSYQNLAYNVAYRLMGDPDGAADACQEAFIKAFKAIDQYQGGSFKAWLMRIVTNTCYDQMRYQSRRPVSSLEETVENSDTSVKLVNGHERPEEHALRQELSEFLQAAINALPDDQRTVIVLSDVHGFNYQEIAEVTSEALGTVKSRLSRARRKVRDYLLQQQELLPTQYRLKSS